MIPSPLAALRAYLAADAELTALVGEYVYAAELPRAAVAAMPRKAIVAVYAGAGSGRAGSRDYARIGAARVDLWCYGETPYECERVRLVAYRRMKELETALVGNVLLFPATKEAGPIPVRDPDTDWPSLIETWIVSAGEADQAA